MSDPLVSVVIPTYKRADLLPRAVDSALAQTYRNIEVVVSDDEDPPGEGWAYLQRAATADPRVRPVRNTGRHGQESNMNHALAHARGAWVKPLHDDDRLLPQCVERFMAYCRGRDHVALAGCPAVMVFGERRVMPNLRGLSGAELIRQRYVHLGMYLQDDVTGGPPTTIFINRRAVEAGGRMVLDGAFRYFSDARWIAEIARHGDSVLIHEPLVEYHQGEHESLSSEFKHKPAEMDAELHVLRQLLYDAIPADVRPPPLETVRQMITVLRAFSQIKARQPVEALKRAAKAPRPRAWWGAFRVTMRRKYPTWFHDTPREVLPPVDANAIGDDRGTGAERAAATTASAGST